MTYKVILCFLQALYLAVLVYSEDQRLNNLLSLPLKNRFFHNVSTIAGHSNELMSSYSIMCSVAKTSLCPPWHFCNASQETCTCGKIPNSELMCGKNWTSYIKDCYCATYNSTRSQTELGNCIFNCNNVGQDFSDDVYHKIPSNTSKLTSFMCGRFNRQGTLCGSCKDGYYPLAYSFNLTCVECDNSRYNWLKYVMVAFLPLTVFYLVILFFRINATSSHLFGFIICSQAISFPIMCRAIMIGLHHAPRLILPLKLLAAFYGIWNLDIGRSLTQGVCIKTNTLIITALELIVGIYPLFLILLTYLFVYLYDQNFTPVVVVVKPLRLLFGFPIKTMRIKTSLIDAFSTFFLLSSMKLLSVSFDLLVPVKVHILEPSGTLTATYRLYFNADVTYFGEFHLPYALLAVAIIICFVLLPCSVLLLYPSCLCQKFLNAFPLRWSLILHTFVDTFQGCFKNGTEPGSIDCRWFSVVHLVTRFLLLLIYALTLDMLYFAFASVLVVILCILIIIVQPYKDNTKHLFLSVAFFICLSCLYSSIIGIQKASVSSRQNTYMLYVLSAFFGAVPLFYATYMVIKWLIRHIPCLTVVRKWKSRYNGYNAL